jgi:hypothetical protein
LKKQESPAFRRERRQMLSSMRRVGLALEAAGISSDSAWSPVFQPGCLHLADADPASYSHVVFACGHPRTGGRCGSCTTDMRPVAASRSGFP